MKILYIHGIAKQLPPKALKYVWDYARIKKDDPNSIMCYWSDVVHPDIQMDNLHGFLASPLDQLNSQTLKAFTSTFLTDVEAYFFNQEKRNQIKRRFRALLDAYFDEPLVIVAHSLGSVIAYEVLSEYLGEDLDIPMFVTIGSPLGIDVLKSQLKIDLESDTLTKPWCVKKWHNFSDPFDIVAADKTLADEYEGSQIQDALVMNPESLRTDRYGSHSISGYLQLKEIQKAINLGLSYGNPLMRPFYSFAK